MINFYYCTHLLGFVVALVYVWVITPRYEIRRTSGIVLAVCSYTILYAWSLVLYWICTGTFGGQNIVRAYVFLPLILWFFSIVCDVRTDRVMDMAAPIVCLTLALAKVGCQYAGCCESWWKVDWGIFNRWEGTRLFPVQLAEALTALGISVFLVWLSKKHEYRYGGRCMAWMLFLFGSTRVVWEFLRDNEKILFGLSELALWSTVMAATGAVWLLIDSQKRKRGK